MIAKKFRNWPGVLVALSLALSLVLALPSQSPTVRAASVGAGIESDSVGHLRAPGQILVKFKDGIRLDGVTTLASAPTAIQPLFARLGVTRITSLGDGTGVLLLHFNGSVDEALKIASADPTVMRVDPNQLLKTAETTTNDPLAISGNQWWLDRIHARDAWTITTGSKAVRVGVVDTGIDANHPDLKGKVVAAYNFAEETATSRPGEGHGTAVAGCITANTNNGIGISGLNWDVSLIDGKGFGEQGSGFSFDLVRGVIFSINQGAQVVNNSWGGGSPDLAVLEMAEYAASKDVTLVFSSGNTGLNVPQSPASLSSVYPNIIAVGATDINDHVVGFSTFGPQVSLVAPGSGIWTTETGGGYQVINGTSFSAPITTGVVALMLSVNPNLKPQDIRSILEGTADDISGQGFTEKTGYGRINAYKAVLAAKNGDLAIGKHSTLRGQVTGVDTAKVRLSLDPLGITLKVGKDGSFNLKGLGNATYRLRAAVAGQGTGTGPVEFKLSGAAGSDYTANFAFQNLKPTADAPDFYVDQARFFDGRQADTTGPDGLYFAASQHNLTGKFRQFWENHGGLAVFGYPLSEAFVERSATDGKLYTVQYFERNRLELHPENAGTPYEILLGLLGSESSKNQTFAASSNTGKGLWFRETRQNLDGQFLEYWQAHGGLAVFGYPISPVIEENGRAVQYFERNRFELHPEYTDTSYVVLLGLLGRDLAQARGYMF